MITSLLKLLSTRNHPGDCIEYVLPRMIEHFGKDFAVFADCGAGVGYTAQKYHFLLQKHLKPDAAGAARIVAYEPLPENIVEMSARIAGCSSIVLRKQGVADFVGKASFVVPRRMQGDSAFWSEGTSALGYLGATGDEMIEIEVVRMESEDVDRFDFVKLDLQGGERAALIGLGAKLDRAKLVYAEQQLFAGANSQAMEYLQSKGFICFFDKILFSVRNKTEIPVKLLSEGGITIDKITLPDGRGLNHMLYGVIDIDKTTKLNPNGTFERGYVNELLEAGVYFLQTDVLAVHHGIYGEFLGLIGK